MNINTHQCFCVLKKCFTRRRLHLRVWRQSPSRHGRSCLRRLFIPLNSTRFYSGVYVNPVHQQLASGNAKSVFVLDIEFSTRSDVVGFLFFFILNIRVGLNGRLGVGHRARDLPAARCVTQTCLRTFSSFSPWDLIRLLNVSALV